MKPTFLCLVLAFVLVSGSTRALADDFYEGKTLTFIVGFAAGGGYDTYTRAIARHIGKHIPGNPDAIVENMDGAGSLVAANHLYSKAPRDGSTIGVFNSAMVLRQALGDRAVRFDGRKLGWIGAPSVGLPACAIMGFTGLKTLDDVVAAKKTINMGATRAGSTTDDLPKILNLTIGTKFRVVSGYRGTSRIRLAMQKQELQGACWGWESMRTTARPMLDAKGDKKLIPFLMHGKSEDPEVKDRPQLMDVVKAKAGDNGTAILTPWLTQYNFQRPLSLPPGTPRERMEILRKAFKATLEDPEFLEDAKRSKLIITHVSGEETEKHVDQIIKISPQARQKLQFLVRGKG